MIGLLLKSKFQIWRNNIFRSGLRRKITYVVWYGLSLYLFALILLWTRKLFVEVARLAPAAPAGVLGALFSGLITFALFWGLGNVLTQLYLASDMELLLTAPVRRWDVFVIKLLEAIWAALTPAALALAALLGYGWAQGAGALYYIWAVLALLALLALVVSLSMLLVMLIMRVVPAKRARELLALVWIVFFGGLWFGWMLLSGRGSLLTALAGSQQTLVGIGRAAGWSPAGWAANSVVALAAGNWVAFVIQAALLLAGATVAIAAAYWVYERTFYRAWAALREGVPRARPAGTARSAPRERRPVGPLAWLRQLPWPAGELAAKDWTTLPRDLRWLSRLVMPLVVAGFYVYSLGFSSEIPKGLAGLPFWVGVLLGPLMCWLLSSAICMPALAGEGTNIALLRTAPLSAGGVLWGKVAATAPLVLSLSGLATLGVTLLLGMPAVLAALSVAQTVWLAVLFSIAGVAAGGLAPNYYQAETARRPAGLAGSYTLLGLSALLAASHVGLVASLVARFAPLSGPAAVLTRFLESPLPEILASPWAVAGCVLAYGVSLLALVGAWRMARRRLELWQPGM